MLDDTKTFSSFATDDLEATRAFYADTLGVRAERVDPMPLVELHLAGGRVMVYEKPDFVPATYTVLNFVVDDVDAAVDALAEKGVAFEIYDGFEQDEKGIARGQGGGPDIAWFRDPAGNILSVVEDA